MVTVSDPESDDESGDGPFLWLGNHPATDLCNTTPVIDGVIVDLLPDAVAVQRWAHQAGLSDAGLGDDPLSVADDVHAIRSALRDCLDSHGAQPESIATLNAALEPHRGCFVVDPSQPHAPVLYRAHPGGGQLVLDVIVGVVDIFRHDRSRVRRCANPQCVLLFVDTSKSGRRRWCDMATCGNRAKVAAHYARQRS